MEEIELLLLEGICEDIEDSTFQTCDSSYNSGSDRSDPDRINRKRRWMYLQNRPFAKINKNDIRRSFPLMWVRVWNDYDVDRYRDFLNHYYCRHAITRNISDSQLSDLFPFMVEHSSTDLTISHYAHVLAVSPDPVCKMLGCQIRRSKKKVEAQVTLHFRISGTLLYDVTLPQVNGEYKRLMSNKDLAMLNATRQLAKQPALFEMYGVTVFDIDAHSGCVTKIICRCYSSALTPL